MLNTLISPNTKTTAITEYPETISSHTIKTGCGNDAKQANSNGNATIANHNAPGATLNITGMQPNPDADLEDTTGTQCTVKVEDSKTLTIKYGDKKCIEITLGTDIIKKESTTVEYGHIFTEGFDMNKVRWPEIISPTLMVIVVIVFLIATIFPPVIIAVLRLRAPAWSPQHNLGGRWGLWTKYDYAPDWNKPSETTPVYAYLWHIFDLLMDIKISLAVVFIYSLQYTRNTKF